MSSFQLSSWSFPTLFQKYTDLFLDSPLKRRNCLLRKEEEKLHNFKENFNISFNSLLKNNNIDDFNNFSQISWYLPVSKCYWLQEYSNNIYPARGGSLPCRMYAYTLEFYFTNKLCGFTYSCNSYHVISRNFLTCILELLAIHHSWNWTCNFIS